MSEIKLTQLRKSTVEADLHALKDLLEKTKDTELSADQVTEMKAAQEKLMTSAQALFAKVYEQAQGAQGAAGPDMGTPGDGMGTGGASNGGADDVVDGDYREV